MVTSQDLRRLLTPFDMNVLVHSRGNDDPDVIADEIQYHLGGRRPAAQEVTDARARIRRTIEGLVAQRRARAREEEGVHRAAVAEARRRKKSGPRGGKRVTFVPQDVTPQETKEEKMAELDDVREDGRAEGFADRVAREAQEEAEKVLRDLSQVRFRADQVVRVLKALDLPVPPELQDLGTVPVAAVPVEAPVEPVQPPSEPPTPPDAPVPPLPPPAAEDPGERAGTKAELKAARLQALIAVAKRLGTFSVGQLAQESGVPRGSLHSYLTELVQAGVIFRLLEGGYRHKDAEAPETPPGAERAPAVDASEVPEHLRRYPAAQSGGSLPQRVATAEKEHRIVGVIEERARRGKTSVAMEIAKEAPDLFGGNAPQTQIEQRLKILAHAGIILATGKSRWHEDQSAGRGANEYDAVAVTEQAREGEEPTPEPPAAPSEPDQAARPTDNEVRDAVVGKDAPFTEFQILRDVGMEPSTSAAEVCLYRLQGLARRGCVADVSPGEDMHLFEYVDPKTVGPGRAAEIDAERRRTERAAAGNGTGPVPGTGTGASVRSSNKDVQQLLEAARAAGANVSKTGAEHFAIENPANGRRVIVYGTPGAPSSDKNKKKLAGIGISVG